MLTHVCWLGAAAAAVCVAAAAGENAPLEAGWGVCSMLRALELLKYTWTGFNPEVYKTFMAWVDRVIMIPSCIYQANYQSWAFLNNWHSTVAELKAQLAAMRGDKVLWREALEQAEAVFDSCERGRAACRG